VARRKQGSGALGELRRYSYATLLYRQVRSGVVHEFCLGDDATGVPMSSLPVAVSNSNRLEVSTNSEWEDPHETGRRYGSIRRQIHFSVSWLADIARSTAANLKPIPTPVSDPEKWWIAGVAG
jgi:hypothetical protein